MKPEIFAVELKSDIADSVFDYLFRFADKDKQERINRMKMKSDKDLTLTGDILAKTAIKKVFGIPMADIKFRYGESGKPYAAGYPNIHFNISHSGSAVVCAVYDRPVGIDIQIMKNGDFDSLAKRVFTEKEQGLFFSAPQDVCQEQFYRIWTAKESYLKYLGTGIKDLKKDIDGSCAVSTCRFSNNYIISICTKR